MNQANLSAFIWSVADLLRGDYKPHEYGKVILPFTVLRRLDCVLAPTKAKVLKELEAKTKAGVNPDPFLKRASGQSFYNSSDLDLSKLLGDQDHIKQNLYAYLQGFSPEARDIFERYDFATQIERPPRDEAEWVLATAGSGSGAVRASLSRTSLAPVRTPYAQVTLEQLEEASRTLAEGGFPPASMHEILCVQSGALGGTRPKAAMSVDGREVIAKFQQPQLDTFDVPKVEAACLALARRAGIDAISASLVTVHGRSVLLVDRFDRRDSEPVHYLSARSLLNIYRAAEQDTVAPAGRATYAAMAAAARRIGVEGAGPELFRRLAFNYAIGNTDDHLQNHGFLFDGTWRLAPAFDLVAQGGESLAIGAGRQGRSRTRENVLSGAGDFGLKPHEAEELVEQAIQAARGLGDELDRLAIPADERAQVLQKLCAEAQPDVVPT